MKPRVGMSLVSTTDATTVVVVRWGDREIDVSCGGAPMIVGGAPEESAERNAPDHLAQDGTLMGKRYVDEAGDIELLCVKPGTGTLAIGGVPLVVKDARPLPASD